MHSNDLSKVVFYLSFFHGYNIVDDDVHIDSHVFDDDFQEFDEDNNLSHEKEDFQALQISKQDDLPPPSLDKT